MYKGDIPESAGRYSRVGTFNTVACGWKIRAATAAITAALKRVIWVKSGVPLEEDARTVVSERGDTLSPK